MKSVNTISQPCSEIEMTDHDLAVLSNVSEVKVLNIGDPLFKNEKSDDLACIILSGRIKFTDIYGDSHPDGIVIDGKEAKYPVVFRQLFPEMTAVAVDTVKMLILDNRSFNSLDPTLQVFLWKQTAHFASFMMEILRDSNAAMEVTNAHLKRHILNQNTQVQVDYLSYDLIQDIICKIPQLPVFIHELNEKLSDDNASQHEIARLVQQDPSMTANILKLINSPFYGFQNKISDIHQAVVLLGLNELSHIVLSIGLQKTMPNSSKFNELFHHSGIISRISFEISLLTQIGKPAHLRTIGLVHDIGESVILLIKRQNPKLSLLIDKIDTACLGGLLLKQWGLPTSICDCVSYLSYPMFSEPDHIPDDIRNEVSILYIAHLCCDYITGVSHNQNPPLFLEAYKRRLNWKDISLENVIKTELMPKLKKNINTYPAFFRRILVQSS